jgi:choloylglycine hydrolase
VEPTYSPYSTQPQHNKGVGTYFSTTADMKNLRYDFPLGVLAEPGLAGPQAAGLQRRPGTRHITDMHLCQPGLDR